MVNKLTQVACSEIVVAYRLGGLTDADNMHTDNDQHNKNEDQRNKSYSIIKQSS